MKQVSSLQPGSAVWQQKLYAIIFEANTPSGKLFDVILLWSIALSVAAVILESVSSIQLQYGFLLRVIEWFFTIIFTIEYALRVACVSTPRKYIFSFFGIVDLLSIIPTYLTVILTHSHYLLVIRAVRLLRVFRVLKLSRYVSEADILTQALAASRRKITVFIGAVITFVLITGSLMHLIEGPANGFTNIPKGIYWAIVTLTTVGYGDITPQTPLGQFVSALVMILGYGVIAVPTGIVSVELSRVQGDHSNAVQCELCAQRGHSPDAVYCKFCGEKLTV